ncbi:MAG: hypothetical protein ACREN5_11965, partial [Gemmatimonadales bacterium]
MYYTSTVSPTLPLRVDTSFYEPGASVLGLTLVGAAVGDTLPPPTFSPAAGTFTSAPSVTISAASGATIRYT